MRSTNMGCRTIGLFFFFFTFSVVFQVATMSESVGASKEFKVGDAQGWRQPPPNDAAMYNQWAAKKRFHVGDSLRFEYKNDSVLVVDKWGYYHCNTSNPTSAFNDGNSVVNVEKPGTMYIISGDPDHCKNGQRMFIEVIHPKSHSPPSPIATSPQAGGSAHSPISPTSSSSSSSSSNLAAFSVHPASLLIPVAMALMATFGARVWCMTD